MPIYNPWESPVVDLPGVGKVNLASHDDLFHYADRPLRFFLEPIVVALNYMEDHSSYPHVYMTGLSGGGWTTTVFAALDPRIERSFPVAGSVPIYLRIGNEGLTDSEQVDPGFYSIANYEELYTMGAFGENRLQYQILNRVDSCCFYGNRFTNWIYKVRATVAQMGEGEYRFYSEYNPDVHAFSSEGLSIILGSIPPVMDPVPNLTADNNSGEQSYTLTGIAAASIGLRQIQIQISSDNYALFEYLTIDYTSPNRIGTLRFLPKIGASGVARVTVTLRDTAAPAGTFRRSFDITIKPPNQPATVQLLSPTNGSVLQLPQPVTLQAAAVDPNGTVVQVEFLDGTNSVGVVSSPPYSLVWSNATEGTHTLSALATDDRGATAFSGSTLVTVVSAPTADTRVIIHSVAMVADPSLPEAGRQFQLHIEGPDGSSVVVEASATLSNWVPISTNTLVNGTVVGSDADAIKFPRRFYRVRAANQSQ